MDETEEDTPVAKKGHTEEQILRALPRRRAAPEWPTFAANTVSARATFYIWKKKYSGLGLSELREENSKLKHLVPSHPARVSCKKSCEASSSTRAWALDADRVRAEHAAGVGADDDQSIDHELPEPA